jgi:excisionase family DNA binding protein
MNMAASGKQRKTVTAKPSPAEARPEQQKATVAPDHRTVAVARVALSVEEAAQAVGLSERYVWDLVKSGALRTKRVGRRRIVPVEALQEFMQ